MLETKTDEQINKLESSTNMIKETVDKQKEETNDLSIKNSRLWAKEQIRLEHDKLVLQRKDEDNDNERKQCATEVTEGTIVFQPLKYQLKLKKMRIRHVLIPIAMNY